MSTDLCNVTVAYLVKIPRPSKNGMATSRLTDGVDGYADVEDSRLQSTRGDTAA